MFFKTAPNGIKYLGYFCKKTYCQKLSKIAQSGHTDSNDQWKNLLICSSQIGVRIILNFNWFISTAGLTSADHALSMCILRSLWLDWLLLVRKSREWKGRLQFGVIPSWSLQPWQLNFRLDHLRAYRGCYFLFVYKCYP